MSTNYYLNNPQGKTYHIGKQSGGWQFLFDTAEISLGGPELPVTSFENWKDCIVMGVERFGWKLEDEYGREIAPVVFIARVMETQRTGKNCWTADEAMSGKGWGRVDDDGYFFDKRGFWFSKSRDFG